MACEQLSPCWLGNEAFGDIDCPSDKIGSSPDSWESYFFSWEAEFLSKAASL
jgi:hypothetical protein